VATSAKTGAGLDDLQQEIVAALNGNVAVGAGAMGAPPRQGSR
jgi:hypothetical protein